MKVNFSTELVDLDGKPLNERAGVQSVAAALTAAGVSQMLLEQAVAALRPFWGTGGEPEEVKLSAMRACANALQNTDASVSGAERVDRIRLALKLMDTKQPVEVAEKEKATILAAVEKTYGALVYFRVHELFELAAAPKQPIAEAA